MTPDRPKEIPQVAGWPLIGSARELAREPDTFIMEAGRAHGGLARVRSHRRVFIAVTDADYIRQVLLTRHQSYRRSHAFGRPLLGEGLLTTDGAGWQKRRRQMSAVFRFDMLDVLAPIMRSETNRMLDRWAEAESAGRGIAVADEMYRLVIRALAGAIMSSTSSEERDRLGETIVEGLRQTQRRNSDALHLPRALPTP